MRYFSLSTDLRLASRDSLAGVLLLCSIADSSVGFVTSFKKASIVLSELPFEVVRFPRRFTTFVWTDDSYPPIEDRGAPVGLGLVATGGGEGSGGGPAGGGMEDFDFDFDLEASFFSTGLGRGGGSSSYNKRAEWGAR